MRNVVALVAVLGVLTSCSVSSEMVGSGDSGQPTGSTTLPPITANDLVAALPNAMDLPDGWSRSLEPFTTFRTGGRNLCTNRLDDDRALESGATALVFERGLNDYRVQGGHAVTVYAFPSAVEAESFMATVLREAQICPDGVQYRIDSANFYLDGNPAVVDFQGQVSAGPVSVESADQSFAVSDDYKISNTDRGVESGYAVRSLRVYARSNEIVLTIARFATVSLFGLEVQHNSLVSPPTLGEIEVAVEHYLPRVKKSLAQRPLPTGVTSTAPASTPQGQ